MFLNYFKNILASYLKFKNRNNKVLKVFKTANKVNTRLSFFFNWLLIKAYFIEQALVVIAQYFYYKEKPQFNITALNFGTTINQTPY